MFKPFYCCFGLFLFWNLISKMSNQDSFYSNFQGFTYCSIFDFQGSLLLSVSAATRLVYQMLFCLSTTFLFIFSNFFEVRRSCFTRRLLTLSYLLVVVKQKFLFFHFRVKKNNHLEMKRRKRDLNPRAGCPTYTLSRGASSASWVFLRSCYFHMICQKQHLFQTHG